MTLLLFITFFHQPVEWRELESSSLAWSICARSLVRMEGWKENGEKLILEKSWDTSSHTPRCSAGIVANTMMIFMNCAIIRREIRLQYMAVRHFLSFFSSPSLRCVCPHRKKQKILVEHILDRHRRKVEKRVLHAAQDILLLDELKTGQLECRRMLNESAAIQHTIQTLRERELNSWVVARCVSEAAVEWESEREEKRKSWSEIYESIIER